MQFILKNILHFMPIFFGIGFLGPLVGQGIAWLAWPIPLELSPLSLGLIIGGLWGLFAQLTGRWI
ncbi:MAG: hypothetical protein ABJO01_03555 [Parasphingorhabdus sp.]|uniref:hypothetical protein n=1 Tax=Parasphingorhabdus sp. TaxID=2709688 RepID=UPI0032982738